MAFSKTRMLIGGALAGLGAVLLARSVKDRQGVIDARKKVKDSFAPLREQDRFSGGTSAVLGRISSVGGSSAEYVQAVVSALADWARGHRT